jgi:UDP-N-acetylmuramate dehydrogenase
VLTPGSRRLADWTTLRLGGPSAVFLVADRSDDVIAAVSAADGRAEPVLVLGGGSNLVVADEGFPGSTVQVATAGIDLHDAAGVVQVTAQAGESWEHFVERVVAEGLVGVEALAGIPGSVGAAPIQNVGAYGQEVADTICAVEVYDRAERRVLVMSAADCRFGYRSSRFKAVPDRFVILAVTFALHPSGLGLPVTYAELAGRLGIPVGQRAPAAATRRAVLELRTAKGMVLDPADHDTWSAGSFFTNPIVERSALPAGAPAFDQPDGRVKTSAAWLIERAGFTKGYGDGDGRVTVSTKHSLALTNRGSATTDQLLALAREIRSRVQLCFGIRLDVEPVLVGCTLD